MGGGVQTPPPPPSRRWEIQTPSRARVNSPETGHRPQRGHAPAGSGDRATRWIGQ